MNVYYFPSRIGLGRLPGFRLVMCVSCVCHNQRLGFSANAKVYYIYGAGVVTAVDADGCRPESGGSCRLVGGDGGHG